MHESTALHDAPTFASLGVPSSLDRPLRELGAIEPFPIQRITIPDAIAGRDVIARGRTGSGKTIAFAVPTVARLAALEAPRRRRRPRALVLVPTRELATQVAATFAPLAAAMKLRVDKIYGGVGYQPQITALDRGSDVLVACPGRLEDLLARDACHLDDVRIAVLDEADHLAELGFLPAVRRLLDRVPKDAQKLLFSATIDDAIDALVRRYLHDPVVHLLDPAESHVPDMEHHLLHVTATDKPAVVRELASGVGKTLLFTRTKHGAKRLTTQLNASGIRAVELHGNLSQNARTRNLEAFSGAEANVLVATDIAARGIHVDDVGLVVHVDPPAEHKAYVHRSGRTARAGSTGTVVTIATPDQRKDVHALARKAGIRAEGHEITPDHPFIAELRGDRATLTPFTRPAPAPAAPRAKAPKPAGARRTKPPAPRADGTPARTGNRRRRANRRPR